MKLRRVEVLVMELLRVIKKREAITAMKLFQSSTLGNVIGRLVEEGAVRKLNNGDYEVMTETYEVITDREAFAERMARHRKVKPVVKTTFHKQLEADYEKMSRTELAKKYKLTKPALNQLLIEIGVGS